jgi:hypothetical protein
MVFYSRGQNEFEELLASGDLSEEEPLVVQSLSHSRLAVAVLRSNGQYWCYMMCYMMCYCLLSMFLYVFDVYSS